MSHFTNLYDIDISLAVWLVHDDYDFVPKERAISSTALLKPTRQIILSARVDTTGMVEDISSRIAMRSGHAYHDSIEQSWLKGYKANLASLNIPPSVIDRFKINPKSEDLQDGDIPVWLESRGTREINGWKISGKMDMSFNYRLKDFKTTSVYTYIKGSKDEDYSLQMSLYKWIHPDKVKDDEGDIQFIFTDWQKAMTNTAGYPPLRVKSHTVPLYDDEQIEAWIEAKLEDLEKYADAPQEALPRCSDAELWRSDPVWKYFSNPDKTDGRATKNFDNAAEAYEYRAKAGKGVVKEIPGKVKACLYCKAFEICEQRKEYDFDD